MDESDENTKRWKTDPVLLATERRHAESERSDLRSRPRPERNAKALGQPSSVPPQPVELGRVRALYEQFVHVIGPAAKAVFENELRALQLRPSAMTERDFAMLVERLMRRIPEPGAGAAFKARALVEPWP